MDLLNDERYYEQAKVFRSRTKRKYASTEIAYIMRGLDSEPELLELCNQDNVKMVKRLLRDEAKENISVTIPSIAGIPEITLYSHNKKTGAITNNEHEPIKCCECGEEITVTWCRHITTQPLRDALPMGDISNLPVHDSSPYPEVDCRCTRKHDMRPTLSGDTAHAIEDTALFSEWGEVLFELEDM